MVAGVFYAIRKERLFDVRVTILRSIASGATVILTLSIYITLLLFILSSVSAKDKDPDNTELIVTVITLIITVTTYPRLRRFISILAQSLFKSRQYQVQEGLNLLNRTLVAENSRDGIIRKSETILKDYTSASLVDFVFNDDESRATALNKLSRLPYRNTASSFTFREDNYEYADYSLSYKLSGSAGLVGFMLIGHKDNGSTFTRIDKQLLDISSKTLAIALENAINTEKIINFNQTLKNEVKSATESLRNSNERLKELDKQKDELMSMASHQIRPQLTATRGFLDLLRDEGNKKERNELISLSTSSVERMIGVVTDMLNLSRYSGGKFEIIKTKTDLAAMLDREVITQNSFAESSGFNIHLNKKPAKAWVMADEAKLREVIANLIHNAVQYGSKEKPIVDINLSTSNGAIELTVRDYGIGVPKDQQDQMFKKFFRATNAKEKRPAGSGVGLFLAKKVIDGHEGKLIFESEEGKGSTFGFSLPILEK